MEMRNIVIGLIVLIIIAVGVVAYTQRHTLSSQLNGKSAVTSAPVQDTQAVSPTSAAMSPEASPSGGEAMTAEEKTVTVEGSEFKFNPMAITLTKGEKVKIVFKNAGNYPHNLTIADLNVMTKTIQPGQSDTVEFTPSKAGTFTMICGVDSHAEKGMKGTVTVQ
jgi:plastocyanin